MKTLKPASLSDKERNSIMEAAQILKRDLPVSRIILFGSKARNTAMADSDIDLLILTSVPVTGSLRENISERLAQINLDYDVDLSSIVVSEHDWAEGLIHHTLIYSEVERDGCVV